MAQALKIYFYFGPEVVLHIPDLHFTFLNWIHTPVPQDQHCEFSLSAISGPSFALHKQFTSFWSNELIIQWLTSPQNADRVHIAENSMKQ